MIGKYEEKDQKDKNDLNRLTNTRSGQDIDCLDLS